MESIHATVVSRNNALLTVNWKRFNASNKNSLSISESLRKGFSARPRQVHKFRSSPIRLPRIKREKAERQLDIAESGEKCLVLPKPIKCGLPQSRPKLVRVVSAG